MPQNFFSKPNKKAVSLMLSYVILIVIAISLSIGVYSWLKFQANIEDIDKCPENVALIIQDYDCSPLEKEIILTVQNKGLFDLMGFIVRGTDDTDPEALPTTALKYTDEEEEGRYYFKGALAPNKVDTMIFSFVELTDLTKIQIEPFRIQEDKKGKKKPVLCDMATITQEIVCEIVVEEKCWEIQTDACVEIIPCPEPCEVPSCYSNSDDCDDALLTRSNIPDSLISWWRFEGDATDEISGYGATSRGSVNFVDGKIGTAMEILNDETNSYLRVDEPFDNLKFNEDFTLESWVKLNTIPTFSFAYIVGEFNGATPNYALKIETTGEIGFYWAGNQVAKSSVINIGEWYYIAGVKNSNDFTLYVKDETGSFDEAISGTSSGSPSYGDVDLIFIGRIGNGLTDELAVYNDDLDGTTILEHYQNTVDGSGDYFT